MQKVKVSDRVGMKIKRGIIKNAYLLLEKELISNNIKIQKRSKNVWILNNKMGIVVAKRTIQETHSRSVSIQDSNPSMQELLNMREMYDIGIAFVWNAEGETQRCTIIPISEFVENYDDDTTFYRSIQLPKEGICGDYHMRIRDDDFARIERIHKKVIANL